MTDKIQAKKNNNNMNTQLGHYIDNFLSFTKKIEWQRDCPNDILEAFNMASKIKDSQKNNDFFQMAKFILQTSEYLTEQNKLTTKESSISSSEIIDLLLKAISFINEKEELSLSEGKKILVLMGERHGSNQSLLLEFAILSYLKSKNFSSFLAELNQEFLERTLETSNQEELLEIVSAIYLAHNILDYKLHPIDPLANILGELRNDLINENIYNYGSENQVAIVGSGHLGHILSSKIVNKKFVIAAINLDDLKHSPHVIKIFSAFAEQNDQILKLDFLQPLNSFSIGQILDISLDLLPVYLGSKDDFDDFLYLSSNENNRESCILYTIYDEIIDRYVMDIHNPSDYLDS